MQQVYIPFNLAIFSRVSVVDSDRILTSTCSSVNTLGCDLFECEYVGASFVRSSVGTNTDHRRTCCTRSQNPVFSVLEVVIFVRHYGSDCSCSLPGLNLVSKAVLCSK